MYQRRISDWDDAYANGSNIPGGDRWPGLWVDPAKEFRDRLSAAGRARLDLAYGPGERNRFDLFLPEGTPRGLVVFIHGGYWLALDKSYWSHLAAGLLARGYAVAMPSYTLCPAIRIGGIVREVGQAVEAAAGIVAGPIQLTGHSAGGHLAARLATTTSPLPDGVRGRLRNCVPISGLHDLRPLMNTSMNAGLRIDGAEALAESPALLEPLSGIRLTCWAGAGERAEFIRQNELLANVWTGLGIAAAAIAEPDRHHFNVVDGLADTDHPLTLALTAE